MLEGIVLSLCDRTATMVRPWAESGHECWCVDLRHEAGSRRDGRISFIGADLHFWRPPAEPKFAIVFAFPPCTHLASSGARWWRGKGLVALSEAIGLVGICADIANDTGAPWMIENPIGTLSTHWRKPDAQFDPCDFAGYLPEPEEDAYTKRTCLWVGNGFNVPLPRAVFPVHASKMHRLPPSEDRADLRSETPAGFARAVFEANYRMARRAA